MRVPRCHSLRVWEEMTVGVMVPECQSGSLHERRRMVRQHMNLDRNGLLPQREQPISMMAP